MGRIAKGDFGLVEVRGRAKRDWDLIVRPEDRGLEAVPFVLVTAGERELEACGAFTKGQAFCLEGWILGSAAMVPEFWGAGPVGTRSRKPAWWVPQEALEPMAALELDRWLHAERPA